MRDTVIGRPLRCRPLGTTDLNLCVVLLFVKLPACKSRMFLFSEQHSGTVSEQRQWPVRPEDVPTSENTEAGAFLACSSSAVSHHAEDRRQRRGFFRPAHTFHIHFQVKTPSPTCSETSWTNHERSQVLNMQTLRRVFVLLINANVTSQCESRGSEETLQTLLGKYKSRG
ncbi:uncharacterized protein TNCV_3398931 [Trichonephila clavipes]|nr:uncharacterized protein TNCV_3398931 [Trichonephila clavipes]